MVKVLRVIEGVIVSTLTFFLMLVTVMVWFFKPDTQEEKEIFKKKKRWQGEKGYKF